MKRFTSAHIYNYLNYILPCIFIISIVECYLGLWRLATLFKLVSIFFSVILLIRGYYKKNNTVFISFFILSLLSVFSYLYNGRPLECAYNDLFNTIPAMLFFLIALNEKDCNRHFYDYYMYASSAIYLLGIFCYILTPGWYVNSLAEARNASLLSRGFDVAYDGDTVLDSLRFSAFFINSYPISLFSIYTLSLSLFSFFNRNGRGKYSLFCVIISLVTAILSMHRVSIACAVLIIVFFLANEIVKGRGIIVLRIVLVSILVLLASTLFLDGFQVRLLSLFEMLSERTADMSVASAYNERQGLTTELFSQWKYILFGHGIGSGGPQSRFLGYVGVSDAGYAKLLFENGIVGFSLFCILIVSTCLRGLKFFQYYIAELSIIVFVCIAMLGSNSLSLAYLYIIPFWYSLGKIWNKEYLRYVINNNIHV